MGKNIRLRPYETYVEAEILELYGSVGWSNYYENPAMLRQAFEHTLYALGAYAGERLVGIVRAVGDGYSIVYIQDILVAPDCQRQGIGRALMHAVLERFQDVYQVVLMTDDRPETLGFYTGLGFHEVEQLGCKAFLYMKR